MKLNLKALTTITAFAAISLIQTAEAKTAHFGMSGCGVASLIFDNPNDYEEKWKQIVGSIVENYLGIQSSAITSGTSNCRYTNAKTVDARDVFIDVNAAIIAQDAARGSGETIETLATMAGCSDSTTLGTELRTHFSDLFKRELSEGEKISGRVREFMKSNSRLSKSCGNLT